MNGTCECYLYCLLVWMESVNVFLIVFILMEYMHAYSVVCLHKWNFRMLSSPLIYANWICECFLFCLFIWMESMHVCSVVCLYKWNFRMFSSPFTYANWICQWFLYCLFIWMEFVDVFIICLYQWKWGFFIVNLYE
jgi:hypothetical protein